MMEDNPILLWSIKCYKQKASDKSDPHIIYFQCIQLSACTSMEFFQVWFSCAKRLQSFVPFFHSTEHGFCANVVSEFRFLFLLKDEIKQDFSSMLSHLTKDLKDNIYFQFLPLQPLSLLSSVRLILECAMISPCFPL